MLLDVNKIDVSIDHKKILNKFSLTIKEGEIHVIMGPNGTGKSTLSKVILGDKNYQLTSGDILFQGQSIKNLTTDERARKGIFLAYQQPLEIEGVTNVELLKTSLSSILGTNVPLYEFIKTLDKAAEELSIDKTMLHRSVNLGFSGGEKKRNEIMQMKVLEPKLVILDEIDSGLDVDSLRIVGENVMDYYYKHSDCGIVLITHYPRLLQYIKPDYVHIMVEGKIVMTGDISLAEKIENEGYDSVIKTSIMKEKVSHE